MRVYLVESLDPDHVRRLAQHLKAKGWSSSLEDLFWMPLPDSCCTDEQREHAADCGPHALALETGEDFVRLELLVRRRDTAPCSCCAYCTAAQREAMINSLDTMLKELDIPV